MAIKSLIINPGSTSTKIGVFEDETLLFEETLRHSTEEIAQYASIVDQKDFRKEIITNLLKEKDKYFEQYITVYYEPIPRVDDYKGKEVISIILFALLIYVYVRMPKTKFYLPLFWVLVVMIAGAVGNTIDRLFFGFVTDFLYFKLRLCILYKRV